jgi:endoglucanase
LAIRLLGDYYYDENQSADDDKGATMRCEMSRKFTLGCAVLAGLLSAPLAALPWLSTSGTNIVDSNGKTVVLRGVNLGGAFEIEPWMSALNLSSPPSGFPQIQDEVTLWSVLSQRFGSSQMQQLQQTWRTSWLTPADIAQVASMGGNVVRIPFFYQLLQDDSNPGQLIPGGVALLDALVAACAKSGVYAILDLHGAPGGQSSNFTTGHAGLNQLFGSPADQQQTIELWSLLAAHYQNHPEVAGFDLINEPSGATVSQLIDLHNRIYQAVRAVDQKHIIIMEDGYLGASAFPVPSQMGWTNVCYSFHIYHLTALSSNPFENDITTQFPLDKTKQKAINAPFYIGEFSTEGTFISRATALSVLPAYLSALNATGWSWTPWAYKVFDTTNGADKIWGVFTNDTPWNEANPYTDSFSVLQQKFSSYVTSTIQIQPDFSSALMAGLKGQAEASPSITGVVNGASFLAGTASAAWTTITGTNLSQTTRSWESSDFVGNQLPTELDGVAVSIDGIPAYVAYVSPSQINFLTPDDSRLGSVAVQVKNSVGSASSTVQKEGFSPAFFTFPNNYVAAEHADGTLLAPAGLFPGAVANPARPGEVVELYGTGFGPTNPPTPTGQLVSKPEPTENPITVSIGGVNCQVTFAGLIAPGLYQVNATIPADAPNGDAVLFATVQGQPTPNVKINIQQ